MSRHLGHGPCDRATKDTHHGDDIIKFKVFPLFGGARTELRGLEVQ